MIELDNIELIKPLLVFPDQDTYYFIQVLERKDEYTQQRYSAPITSLKGLDRILPNIKDLCQKFEARAYISLIPRSLKKFTEELGIAVLGRIRNGNYVLSNFHLCDSIALHPGTTKKNGSLWLFDVDAKDQKEPVLEWCKKSGICIKAIVPSFSGYHFLVQPFNPRPLSIPKTMIAKIENNIEFGIKKDTNTILYGIS